jgi:hypothetical protein
MALSASISTMQSRLEGKMSKITSSESPETKLSQATTDFVGEGGRVLVSDGQTELDDCARLMSALGIHYDGRRYLYKTYRYDRLADAIAYAQLTGHRDKDQDIPAVVQRAAFAGPSPEDQLVMTDLHISFEAGVYRFDGFQYDRLADAVNYAVHVGKRTRA